MSLFVLAAVACGTGDSGEPQIDAPPVPIDAAIDAVGVPYVDGGFASVDFTEVQCGGFRTKYIQWENIGTGTMTWSISSSDSRFSFDPPSGTTDPGRGGIIVALARAPTATSVAGVDVMADAILTSNLIDSPHTIPMKMRPHGGHITVEPASVDFGTVQVPSYNERMVALRNDGTIQVSVTIQDTSLMSPFHRFLGSSGTAGVAAGATEDALFAFGGSSDALGSHQTVATMSVSGPFLCGTQPTGIALRGTGVSQ